MNRAVTLFALGLSFVGGTLNAQTNPPIAQSGQGKPQVAPPAKSDSYATDEHGRKFRVQNREIANTNFQIAGVDLTFKGDFFKHTFSILGPFAKVASGDASTGLEETCYRSTEEADTIVLIFGEGEVDRSFILSSENSTWKWKTPCRRSSRITRELATASGLRLGQTQEQVIAILGLPTTRSRNIKSGRSDLEYQLESKEKMNSKDLASLLNDELKEHPDVDRRAYIRNYGYYDVWVYVRARFLNDALTTLKISWSETN